MKLDLDELKLRLLDEGGVDNWEWRDESLSNYAEMNDMEIEDFDDSDELAALEMGGVDNWTWYGESLGYFFEYKNYIEDLPENSDYLFYEDFIADPSNLG